jgi:hypothetical protein
LQSAQSQTKVQIIVMAVLFYNWIHLIDKLG